jgi:arginine/serine-rich splicing factor 12
MPDELSGLQLAQDGGSRHRLEARMPPNVTNEIEGEGANSLIYTRDPRLEANGLPLYPPLPAMLSQERVEEIRRTICVVGLDSQISAQSCMEFFAEAGEVKYFRYCTAEYDPVKYALVEFSEQSSILTALMMNDRQLGSTRIKVTHATMSITKPVAKSNEAAQKEIEEAMSRVKEAQSLVSAAVDPLMGMLGGVGRSRSRSRSRRTRTRSRSRGRYSRRSRSRGSRRRSRSRSRRRSRSRERRRRSRSRSRDRKRRSKSKDKKRRSKSRDRKKDKADYFVF